jgi:hypothetical protein
MSTPSTAMDVAEEAAMAKELTQLNASAKGFCGQFVLTRNVLVNALPMYDEGATASRHRTICDAIERIGLQADKVHNAYLQLIEFDPNKNRHQNFYKRQQLTGNEHNNIIAQADEVLGREEGPLQQQQPGQGGVQGNIVAATVAAMQAANGGNHIGPKKIDYHLKPKI